MSIKKPRTEMHVDGSNSRQWLPVSLVLSVVVLVGMFLPWVIGFDLGSLAVVGGKVNGWRVSWLLIPILIGLAMCIGVVFIKPRALKLLILAPMICFCVASLILIIDLGLVTLGGSGKGSFGTFVIISKVPLAGFWMTLLGVIGMIVFGVMIGIKSIIQNK